MIDSCLGGAEDLAHLGDGVVPAGRWPGRPPDADQGVGAQNALDHRPRHGRAQHPPARRDRRHRHLARLPPTDRGVDVTEGQNDEAAVSDGIGQKGLHHRAMRPHGGRLPQVGRLEEPLEQIAERQSSTRGGEVDAADAVVVDQLPSPPLGEVRLAVDRDDRCTL